MSLLEGESGTTSSGEPGDSGEASLAGDSGDCGCGMIWPERSAKAGGRDFFKKKWDSKNQENRLKSTQ